MIREIINLYFAARLLGARRIARYAVYFAKKYLLLRKIPGTAVFAATFRCQCNCGACSSGIFSDYFAGKPEMTTEAALKRISEIADAGTPRIHFTGGEPLLRDDLPELARAAASRGMAVFVETNGLLLTEEIAIKLKTTGVTSVNVSLDSADADGHDKSRELSGCYEKAAAAIKICVECGLPCMVSTYATKENIRDGGLAAVIKLARELGCAGVRVLPPQPSGRWINRPEIILDEADLKAVKKILPHGFLIFNRTPLIKCPQENGYKIFILSDGSAGPCEHLPFVFSGSKDEPLSEILRKTRGCGMFSGNPDCLLRDKKFRGKYLKGEIKSPVFI